MPALQETLSPCVLWQGRTFNDYGVMSGGRFAHRVAYDLIVADPTGLMLDHKCHVFRCVNTFHLRPATPTQNQLNRSGAASHSKTGIRGVFGPYPEYKLPWIAQVRINGKAHQRRFATVEEAAEGVAQMRAELLCLA